MSHIFRAKLASYGHGPHGSHTVGTPGGGSHRAPEPTSSQGGKFDGDPGEPPGFRWEIGGLVSLVESPKNVKGEEEQPEESQEKNFNWLFNCSMLSLYDLYVTIVCFSLRSFMILMENP